MLYTLVILHQMTKLARGQGGIVRPIDVERAIAADDDLSQLKISRYKIRSFFKECNADGLLLFDGHKYIWRETHWLNGAGNDVIAAMQGGKR